MSWLDDIRAALGQAQAPLQAVAAPLRPGISAVAQAIQPAAQTATAGLQSGLQTAGDVADTPGSILRGVGAGVGTQMRGDDGSDYLRRAVAGILDPSQRVTGQEVNQNAGLGSSPLGGAVTNILTDPIAMGAAAKLSAAGLGALGRSLGGDAANMARAAAPAAERFSAPGLTTMTRDAAGNVSVGTASPAVAGSTVAADGTSLFPQGNRALSTAEQWTGPRLSQGMTSAMDSSLAPGQTSQAGAGDLLGLRRNFTVLKDVGLDATNQPTFRAVGGLEGGVPRAQTVMSEGNDAISSAMRSTPDNPLHGQYSPAGQTATIMQGASPGTLRHESMHGLIDAARQTGDASALSLIPRLSANAQESSSPFIRGLGQIGEEASAYGAEARSPLGQVKNMWNFLDNPQAGYADQFARESPVAAALYRNAVLPNTVRGAGVGAAGVGTGTLATLLGGNQ